MKNDIFGSMFELELERHLAAKRVSVEAVNAVKQYCDELLDDHELNRLLDIGLAPHLKDMSKYDGEYLDGVCISEFLDAHGDTIEKNPIYIQLNGTDKPLINEGMSALLNLRMSQLMLNENLLSPCKVVIHSDNILIKTKAKNGIYELAIEVSEGEMGEMQIALRSGYWGDPILSEPIECDDAQHYALIASTKNAFQLRPDKFSRPPEVNLKAEIDWSKRPIEIFADICAPDVALQYVKSQFAVLIKDHEQGGVANRKIDTADYRANNLVYIKLDDKLVSKLARELREESYLKDCSTSELLDQLMQINDVFRAHYSEHYFGNVFQNMINHHLEDVHQPGSQNYFKIDKALLDDLVVIEQFQDRGYLMKDKIRASLEFHDDIKNYQASLKLADSLAQLSETQELEPTRTASIELDSALIKGAL
ncbi:hypothetical protein [Shewanella marisflavi]|uniref:hypothetical protein n=1 Tax=Shewanella marisflavi TaxID=260364 RepID=UPI003AAAD010